MRFEGYRAIVTGAASGLGLATTQRLRSEGCNVLAVDRNPDTLALAGGPALSIDVSERGAAQAIVAEAEARLGGLDILVNNAGFGQLLTLEESDDDHIDAVLATNLTAILRLTREALRIIRRPGGSIVNIASIFGEAGFPRAVVYGTTKGAVAQFTRNLAADVTPYGVRVNAVAPGLIETPGNAAFIYSDEWYMRNMQATIPARRVGKPAEIAAAVAFLCSEGARFITGTVLPIDGGYAAV